MHLFGSHCIGHFQKCWCRSSSWRCLPVRRFLGTSTTNFQVLYMRLHIRKELHPFGMPRSLPSRLQRLIALQTWSHRNLSQQIQFPHFVGKHGGLDQIANLDPRFGDSRKDVMRRYGLYIYSAGVHFHHVQYQRCGAHHVVAAKVSIQQRLVGTQILVACSGERCCP
jgi:hypothetical protein